MIEAAGKGYRFTVRQELPSGRAEWSFTMKFTGWTRR